MGNKHKKKESEQEKSKVRNLDLPNPEVRSNVFSQLIWGWLTPVIWLATKRSLEMEDLYPVRDQDRAKLLSKKYRKTEQEIQKNKKGEDAGDMKVWTVLKKIIFGEWLFSGISKIISTGCQIGQPLVLQEFLNDLEEYETTNTRKNSSLWWVLAYMIISFGFSFAQNTHIDQCVKIGYKVRTMLVDLVFRKSFHVNLKTNLPDLGSNNKMGGMMKGGKGKGKRKGKGKKEEEEEEEEGKETEGKKEKGDEKKGGETLARIINLMGADTMTIMHGTIFLHEFWSSLIIIVVSIIMLCNILGWSGFIGSMLMIGSFPLNAVLIKKLASYYGKIMSRIDIRIKLINEMVNAMKLIKLYAWEHLFQKKISKSRTMELKSVKDQSIVRVVLIAIWTCLPVIVATLIFLIYVKLGNELTPSKVFTAIMFINVMRIPLLLIPMAIASVVQAFISWKRVRIFLETPEMNEESLQLMKNRVSNRKKDDLRIKLKNASFNWVNKKNKDDDGEKKKKNIKNGGEKLEIGDTTGRSNPSGTSYTSSTSDTSDTSDNLEILTDNEDSNGEDFALKDINLEIQPNKLTMIVGPVGSGKSSLLYAILGELPRKEGSISVKGTIAYCPQEAWIQNATLKENIVFFKEFDDNRYKKVISCCALDPDFKILPGGDQTEIGEKGVNLSGGQKARVSLARSVYADKEIVLLDDPLSAVDAHVGRHIFDKCIKGDLLLGKTIVLVTHQLQFLPQADHVIVMNKGKIIERGTYRELILRGFDFSKIVKPDEEEEEEDDQDQKKKDQQITQKKHRNQGNQNKRRQKNKGTKYSSRKTKKNSNRKSQSTKKSRNQKNKALSSLSTSLSSESDDFGIELSQIHSEDSQNEKSLDELSQQMWIGLGKENGFISKELELVEKEELREQKQRELRSRDADLKSNVAGVQLTKEEIRQFGKVDFGYYIKYIKSLGGWTVVFVISILLILYTVSTLGAQYWLALWIDGSIFSGKTEDWFLGIYCGIGFSGIAFQLIRGLYLTFKSLRASRILHVNLLKRVIRAPMSYFDTTPAGRILNRFNKDQMDVDLTLSGNLVGFITTVLSLIISLLMISVMIPIFLIPCIIGSYVYYKILNIYRPASRDIKRLESISRSPIINNFSATLSGLPVIRAFGYQKHFNKTNIRLLDRNTSSIYCQWCGNRWLNVRVTCLAAVLSAFAAFFVWYSIDSVGASYASMAVSLSVGIASLFSMIVRNFAELEKSMNSIERIIEYSKIDKEAKLEIQETRPHQNWPNKGQIEFKNIKMRYREGLKPVLKGISAKIRSNEKIGIIGRTGSGKSSLVLCLFRIVELFEGKIKIDGRDISKIGLHDLRKKLSIIPQDPVLFTGTIRDNLDPFSERGTTDEEMWKILDQVYLKEKIQSLPNKLDQDLNKEDSNFSVGEKQLFCLARALVRKAKILVLDEATASVDTETDMLIQNTIRKEFKNCTMITIAHRLNTIMDSDKIMSLDDGNLVEFDKPSYLLKNKKGLLYSLVMKTGKENSKNLIKIADDYSKRQKRQTSRYLKSESNKKRRKTKSESKESTKSDNKKTRRSEKKNTANRSKRKLKNNEANQSKRKKENKVNKSKVQKKNEKSTTKKKNTKKKSHKKERKK